MIEKNDFRDVAQPGSAFAWGASGRWFESSHPDQLKRKSAFYGGFFVLKDHGVVDLNQRGSGSTRRKGRRKYADEGLSPNDDEATQ